MSAGCDRFRLPAGLELTHVPYRSNPQAITDLLGGQISIVFADISTTLPQVKAGKINGLAVSTARRSPLAPDLPTMVEAGVPGYDLAARFAAFAPAKTPRPIVDKFNQALTAALADKATQGRLLAAGIEPEASTPDELKAFVPVEIRKWAEIVEAACIQPEWMAACTECRRRVAFGPIAGSGPPHPSLQPELARDRPQVRRSDQVPMADRHAEELAVERGLPEGEEAVELGKERRPVIVLPDELLQDRGMVRQAVEDAGGGQAIAGDLARKIGGGHFLLRDSWRKIAAQSQRRSNEKVAVSQRLQYVSTQSKKVLPTP